MKIAGQIIQGIILAILVGAILAVLAIAVVRLVGMGEPPRIR